MNLDWSPEQIGVLRRLWAAGKSARAIGGELKTTRNAILGKAHRLGLPARARPVGQPKSRKRNVKRKRPSGYSRHVAKHGKPKQKTRPVMTPIVAPVSLNRSLMDLGQGQCRYPHGDGPYLFCGHPAEEGMSYCPFHHQLCYTPIDKSRQRSTFWLYARAA